MNPPRLIWQTADLHKSRALENLVWLVQCLPVADEFVIETLQLLISQSGTYGGNATNLPGSSTFRLTATNFRTAITYALLCSNEHQNVARGVTKVAFQTITRISHDWH